MIKHSIVADILAGNWENSTIPEIAESLRIREESVKYGMTYLRKKYGITVSYRRMKRGRKSLSGD